MKFLLLLATVDATGQGASLRHIVRHNPWDRPRLRLHAGMEQTTGAERETGGQVLIGLFVCL